MTLDEAIKHAYAVANSKCDSCGTEHRQLANWLDELKELKALYLKVYPNILKQLPKEGQCLDLIIVSI